jgi:histidyl-tRNA synthetase
MRKLGIRCELYPESAKMKKQLSYADNNKIPYVALIGENEIKNSSVTLKNMNSGEQKTVLVDNLKEELI